MKPASQDARFETRRGWVLGLLQKLLAAPIAVRLQVSRLRASHSVVFVDVVGHAVSILKDQGRKVSDIGPIGTCCCRWSCCFAGGVVAML